MMDAPGPPKMAPAKKQARKWEGDMYNREESSEGLVDIARVSLLKRFTFFVLLNSFYASFFPEDSVFFSPCEISLHTCLR